MAFFCVKKTTQVENSKTNRKVNKEEDFFFPVKLVKRYHILLSTLNLCTLSWCEPASWALRGRTAKGDVYATMEGWRHSRWTNEGESSTEELWWCHRAGIILTLPFFFWKIRNKNIIKSLHFASWTKKTKQKKLFLFSLLSFFPLLFFF